MNPTSRRPDGARNVLFIGPDRADFDAIKHCLALEEETPTRAHWENKLESAVACLKTKTFEAIVLDLFLPDSNGPQTLEAIRAAAPNAAIMVIASPEDESLARLAVKSGALDYPEIDG